MTEDAGSTRDPRRRYDDLLVESTTERLPAAELASLHESNEAVREGWVAAAVVLDPDERVLLVDLEGYDGWVAPGGTARPGERLRDAAVREVREETGVDIVPERPHLLAEERFVAADGTVPAASFQVVVFSASAEDGAVGSPASLGVDHETVHDVGWFEELPPDVYGRDRVVRVLTRIRDE